MTILNFLLILVNTLILVSGQFLWKLGGMKRGASFHSIQDIISLFLSAYILRVLSLYGIETVLCIYPN